MFTSLPEALMDSILSFCEYKDTLKVATLNSECHDDIEAFCGRKLARIRETHPVDSSWQFRLGMQVNQSRARQPATLSNRHMLKCARETHLYAIGSRECNQSVSNLLFVPDNNTLLMSGDDSIIRVWDLKTQKFVRSFGPPDNDDIISLHVSEGFIISTSLGRVHKFTMQGMLLDSFGDGPDPLISFTLCGARAFLATSDANGGDPDTITVFDIHSGESTRQRQQAWYPHLVGPQIDMLAVGNWLLVTCEVHDDGMRDNTEAIEQEGIYVLDRSTLEQKSHLNGSFRSIESSSDDSCIVAIDNSGVINVLSMDNGTLTRSCAVPWANARHALTDTLLLVGPLLYIAPRYAEQQKGNVIITVLNINSGEQVRSISYPSEDPFTGATFEARALTTNGRELFCGFYCRRGFRSMSTIKAYTL